MDYKELTYLGLSEKEAKVYLSSLELGKSSAQKIAEKSKVNRATTYVQIESLTKKGLMSSYIEGKKQFFCAEAPEKLELIFRQQLEQIEYNRNRLKDILPELRQIDNKNQDKPVVRYFEGKEGMRAIAEELFYLNNDDVRMIYSYDLLTEMFTEDEILEMRKRRQGKNIKAKIITNDDGYRLKTDAEVFRVDSNKYKITSDIAIFGDKIRVVTQKGEQQGLIIENKEMANTLRVLFDIANDELRKKNRRSAL